MNPDKILNLAVGISQHVCVFVCQWEGLTTAPETQPLQELTDREVIMNRKGGNMESKNA